MNGILGVQQYLGCGKRVVLKLMSDGMSRMKINNHTALFRSSKVDEFLNKYQEIADPKVIDRLLGLR
ncbi:MAG TPA: hypothetical protein DEG92_04265 [Rikenellaceae bacterium]|nr:hypothetical protein [Rikenellaceae bacterium]